MDEPLRHRLDLLESAVLRQRRASWWFTLGATTVAAILAVGLIVYSAAYSEKAFRRAETAHQQAKAAEEHVNDLVGIKSGLLAEIANQRQILDQVKADINKTSTQLKTSAASADQSNVKQAITTALSETNKIASALDRPRTLVFLQFRGAIERSTMQGLQAALQAQGFLAPGSERVAGDYVNGVSYSRPEDKEAAIKVSSIVHEYFAQQCPPARDFPVNQGPPAKLVPQIEVRVYLSCPIK